MREFNPGVQRRRVTTARTDNFFTVATPNIPRPDTSQAERLGRSLGVFEAQAQSFISEEERKAKDEAETKAQIEIETKGLEQVKKDRKEGLYPADDIFLNRALDRQTGTQTAVDWGDAQIARLNPGTEDYIDVNEVEDVESFIRESLSATVQSLGDNKLAQGGFTDASGKQVARVISAYKQAKSQANITKAVDGVFEQFQDTVQAGQENGVGAEEIAEAIHSQYQDISDAMGIPPAEIDRIVVGLAQSQAQAGNYEVVKELLQSDRGGVGPIASKRVFASDAIKILETARREDAKKREAEAFDYLVETDDLVAQGRYTEAEAERQRAQYPGLETDRQIRAKIRQSESNRKQLLKDQKKEAEKLALARNYAAEQARIKQIGVTSLLDGTITQAPESFTSITETGKPKQVSYNTYRDNAVNSFVNEVSPTIATRNNETPQQTFDREVGVFSRAGVKNPQWERQLKAGFSAVTVALVGDRSLVENTTFRAGYKLYTQLFVKAPSLLQAHLAAESKEARFYEQVRALQTYAGYDEALAVQVVFNATKDPQSADSAARYRRGKDIREAISRLGEDADFLFFDREIENFGEVGPRLEQLATIYSTTLSPDDAIKTAAEEIKRTHTIVNGYMVWTGGGILPEGFAAMAEGHLENIAATYELDTDDLTIQPLSNANRAWRVVYRATGHPPMEIRFDDPGAAFTLDMLQAWARVSQLAPTIEARRAVIAERKRRQQERLDAEKFLSNPPVTDLTGAPIGGELEADLQARNRAAQDAKRKEELDKANKPTPPAGNFLGTPLGNQDDIL